MRTVLLNGSPHSGGHTAALAEEFKKHLIGEVSEFNAAQMDLPPCRDCRRCKSNGICVLPKDGMEAVFTALRECERLVIASPIWMETLTPPLLAMLSRLQPWFYRKELRPRSLEKAGVLLTGGGSGGAESAYRTAKVLFKQLNVQETYPLIASTHTDLHPAKEDPHALQAAKSLAEWMN